MNNNNNLHSQLSQAPQLANMQSFQQPLLRPFQTSQAPDNSQFKQQLVQAQLSAAAAQINCQPIFDSRPQVSSVATAGPAALD